MLFTDFKVLPELVYVVPSLNPIRDKQVDDEVKEKS
jgi:hypothetical protein